MEVIHSSSRHRSHWLMIDRAGTPPFVRFLLLRFFLGTGTAATAAKQNSEPSRSRTRSKRSIFISGTLEVYPSMLGVINQGPLERARGGQRLERNGNPCKGPRTRLYWFVPRKRNWRLMNERIRWRGARRIRPRPRGSCDPAAPREQRQPRRAAQCPVDKRRPSRWSNRTVHVWNRTPFITPLTSFEFDVIITCFDGPRYTRRERCENSTYLSQIGDVRGRFDKYLAYKRKRKLWKSGDLFLNIVSF